MVISKESDRIKQKFVLLNSTESYSLQKAIDGNSLPYYIPESSEIHISRFPGWGIRALVAGLFSACVRVHSKILAFYACILHRFVYL